jgi:hypothetical protein
MRNPPLQARLDERTWWITPPANPPYELLSLRVRKLLNFRDFRRGLEADNIGLCVTRRAPSITLPAAET